MFNFIKKFPLAILLLSVTVATNLVQFPVVAQQLNSSEVLDKLKKLSVRIEGLQSGSGVIVDRKKDGDGYIYTVLTNAHVVASSGSYQVITYHDEKYDVSYDQIRVFENQIDLAILQFNTQTYYQVAELGDSSRLQSHDDVWFGGWAEDINQNSDKPSDIQYDTRIIKLLDRQEESWCTEKTIFCGYKIFYKEPGHLGMSGSPVLDLSGYLIAIHGGSHCPGGGHSCGGWAIPINTYRESEGIDFKPLPPKILPLQNLVALGESKVKNGDYAGAIVDYTKAIEENPRNLDAYYRRGEAYYALKKYPEAINDFDEYLGLNPNNYYGYFYRGRIYADRQDYQRAISDYNKAIEIKSDFAKAYNNRGYARFQLGDTQGAIVDYTEAIELNSDYAKAYYNRGLVFGRYLQKYEDALADLNQAINLNPENADAYFIRGIIYNSVEKRDRAINDFTEAIRLRPHFTESYENRALVYYFINERDLALKDLEDALDSF